MSDPRDLWPLRHLIRVMRRHDLTKKDLPTYLQGVPKKMSHSDLKFKSVLGVCFCFSTCVSESEFRNRSIWAHFRYPFRIVSPPKTLKTQDFLSTYLKLSLNCVAFAPAVASSNHDKCSNATTHAHHSLDANKMLYSKRSDLFQIIHIKSPESHHRMF